MRRWGPETAVDRCHSGRARTSPGSAYKPGDATDGQRGDSTHRAQRLGAEIAAEIRNEGYGQRHFLLVDPNGLVLNVMSTI